MADTHESDLVQVAVPREHLLAVYGLLAQLGEASQEADTPYWGGAGAPPAPSTWSVADLQRFASTPSTTSTTIGKVLDLLAEKPGEYFSTSVLEEKTGVPRSKLKGAFSALTRHLKKHYKGLGWMLEWKWGPDLGAGHLAETHYRLTPEQAARWKEARANA